MLVNLKVLYLRTAHLCALKPYFVRLLFVVLINTVGRRTFCLLWSIRLLRFMLRYIHFFFNWIELKLNWIVLINQTAKSYVVVHEDHLREIYKLYTYAYRWINCNVSMYCTQSHSTLRIKGIFLNIRTRKVSPAIHDFTLWLWSQAKMCESKIPF